MSEGLRPNPLIGIQLASIAAALVGVPLAPARGLVIIADRRRDSEPKTKTADEPRPTLKASALFYGSVSQANRFGGKHQHNREIERRRRQAERKAHTAGGG